MHHRQTQAMEDSVRILVTGATGFVGSHVAEALVESGHSVVATVRTTSDTTFLEELGVELRAAPLSDLDGLCRAVEGCEAVVHCAGLVKALGEEQFDLVNARGTERLLEAVLETGAAGRRFVLVSSIAAHGPGEGREPRDELDPARPVSAYGRSKRSGELFALARVGELPITILRPTVVYGPRDREFLTVFKMAARGLGPVMSDRYRLSAVYATDVAAAAVRAVEVEHPSGSIFALADGGDYSQRDLADAAARALGRPSPRTFSMPSIIYDLAAFACDQTAALLDRPLIFGYDKLIEMRQPNWTFRIDRAAAVIGWRPELDLAEGMARAARWYEESGWL